ncbi:MAG: NADH-quinone oxidoreductase subunit J [Candidatus Solibacter usitatus]|nr:NADH-quinone oxidoreductase subunit J [Candidatus Solibacter usitatus]
MLDTIFFYLFALLVVGGGILTITRSSAVHRVLFLFVIMLVNLDEAARERQFNGQWWLALACVVVVGLQIAWFMRKGAGAFKLAPAAAATAAAKGNTEAIADALFSEYLLPFEIASLLLLVAVVGSVVMAKKRI